MRAGIMPALWVERLVFWTVCAGTVGGMFVLSYRTYLTARFVGRGASLRGASLPRMNLRGADLSGADLRDANLAATDLREATLMRADLRGARLEGAALTGARLGGANLYGADLRSACLDGTDLRGTDLRRAVLECCGDARRTTEQGGARYDASTRWPEGFIPEGHGARLEPGRSSPR
jgi:hypothetical protein